VCGFIGKISNNPIDEDSIRKSNSFLTCRGPDQTEESGNCLGSKNFNFENKFIFQIFNRLSIVDLSEKASQPMFSKEFNTSILFNGEIFNSSELRRELESLNLQFKTDHSDTEVALLGLSHFGLNYVNKLKGQFSIVFFNYKDNKVYLIRDRLGQKPLFYFIEKNSLLFSSNLKSLVSNLESREYENSSIYEFLSIGVVTSPRTIFKDVSKVEPAQIIEVNIGEQISISSKKIYWDIFSFDDDKIFDPNIFNSHLSKAISRRLVSDVPIATLISGGIDSTLILKKLVESESEINSFSVTHKGNKYDEKKWIDLVNEKYQTNQFYKEIDNRIENNEIIKSMELFDEPYADPSTYPSAIIYKTISSNYKVVITGDGGDELTNGYKRINQLMTRKKSLSILSYFFKIYPNFLGSGNKLLKNSKNIEIAYNSFFHDYKLLDLLKINSYTPKNLYVNKSKNDFKNLYLSEYVYYLSEFMHLKVDRTSMAASVEARSPFVDSDLVEYMLSLNSTHIEFKNPKKIFKDILIQDFSTEFLDRPKMGFVFNLENWVFKNSKFIINEITNGEISKIINLKNVKKLTLFKTRINALRLWKLLFLEIYFKSIKSL